MAKLILTDTEKEAKLWSDLDDASLGKVVKAQIFKMKNWSDERDKIALMSAATMICAMSAKVNADITTITLTGLTHVGKSIGDWKVTAKKVPQKQSKVP